MKTLTLICGLPGKGKTSLAKKIKGIAIAADDFPGLYVDGKYNSKYQSSAHVWCKQETEKLMVSNAEDIVIHNTFIDNRSRLPYIDLALQYDYSVHIITSEIVILPTKNQTKSIHSVPKNIIDRMRANWESFQSINNKYLPD